MNPLALTDLRGRFGSDLLETEKRFRQQAEASARELGGVLLEVAQRLAGSEVESIRRSDPNAPQNWTAARWRSFFADLTFDPVSQAWVKSEKAVDVAGLRREIARLTDENEDLKRRLATKTALTDAKPETPAEPAAVAIPERTPLTTNWQLLSHANALEALASLVLPEKIPVRFDNRFPTNGLKTEDWQKQTNRRLLILYLISQGLGIRMELDHLVGAHENISARTGTLRRAYEGLIEKNLLNLETLAISAPKTSLALLNLTEDGKELCDILGWKVQSTEHQRLNADHEGQRFPQHTLAVLIFGMHARFRGWHVTTLPDLGDVSTRARPDVYIERPMPDGERQTFYVEVEMSKKDLAEKWSNLVKLQGRVAICARNAASRTRLVGDCKLKNLRGAATDLEILIAPSAPDITAETPLWAEEW